MLSQRRCVTYLGTVFRVANKKLQINLIINYYLLSTIRNRLSASRTRVPKHPYVP